MQLQYSVAEKLTLDALPREILFQIACNARIDELAKISLINKEFAEISRTLQAGLICKHSVLGHTHRHRLRHKNGELEEVTIFRYSGMTDMGCPCRLIFGAQGCRDR